MAFGSIKLIPGVNAEKTPTLLEAGYSTSQFIRWRDGLAQKIGGWINYFAFLVAGVPRALWAWEDLNTTKHLAVGTTTQLGVITDTILTDITPQTLTSDFAPDFSTTSASPTVEIDDPNISTVTTFDSVYFATPIAVGGVILSGLYPIALSTGVTTYTVTATSNATASVTSGGAVPVFDSTSGDATITVTLAAHGLTAGDKFVFPLSTSVGGVTISGTYAVITVPTVDTFTISATSQATSSATVSMNGGDAEIVYYISLGPAAAGAGYGLGTYGTGGYGTGTTSSVQTGTPITATDWTFANWGEILISNPDNGGIYQWSPNGGFSTASLIPEAPLFNEGILISMPAQIMMAYGSTMDYRQALGGIGIQQDPLLIRWCDQENFYDWVDSTTNQAGSFRIPTGSKIVGGLQAPQQTLFWTDLSLWSASYIAFPLVYNFQEIGTSCGLVSKHAAVVFRGSTYWMGRTNFFAYNGNGVAVIPCSVWDVVFQDLDTDNLEHCWCWASTPFNEIWWFYPSASGGTGQCDAYVKYNVIENSWDYGDMNRTCGIDQSILGNPIAAQSNGAIYQHEMTENAAGIPISWSFRTGYAKLGEGEEQVFVDQIIPDGKFGLFNGTQSAQVQITAYVASFPGQTPTAYGPYTFTNSTYKIDTRFRGSLVAWEVSGDDVDSFYRIGAIRFRMSANGRRYG